MKSNEYGCNLKNELNKLEEDVLLGYFVNNPIIQKLQQDIKTRFEKMDETMACLYYVSYLNIYEFFEQYGKDFIFNNIVDHSNDLSIVYKIILNEIIFTKKVIKEALSFDKDIIHVLNEEKSKIAITLKGKIFIYTIEEYDECCYTLRNNYLNENKVKAYLKFIKLYK